VVKHQFASGSVIFYAGIGSGKFRQWRRYAMIRQAIQDLSLSVKGTERGAKSSQSRTFHLEKFIPAIWRHLTFRILFYQHKRASPSGF